MRLKESSIFFETESYNCLKSFNNNTYIYADKMKYSYNSLRNL